MKIGEKCCKSTRSNMYHYMVPKSVVSSFTGLLSKSNELAINHGNKSRLSAEISQASMFAQTPPSLDTLLLNKDKYTIAFYMIEHHDFSSPGVLCWGNLFDSVGLYENSFVSNPYFSLILLLQASVRAG